MAIQKIDLKGRNAVVTLEDRRCLVFSQEIAQRLDVGGEIDEEVFAANKPFAYKIGLERSFGYIAAASRSKKQVEDYLQNRCYLQDDAAKDVMGYLEANGYVNDSLFCEMFVLGRKGEGLGKKAIAIKLKSKGAHERDISAALAGYSRKEELENLEKLAWRVSEANGGMPPFARKEKIISKSVSKGFDFNDALSVAEHVLLGEDEKHGDGAYDDFYESRAIKRIKSLKGKRQPRQIIIRLVSDPAFAKAPEGLIENLVEQICGSIES
ncbi:MAG: RecX family transcriptional regulator [Eubacteriaceae bacterium]|nr:RecX family transcriptional regulator [Eubacteriaceae bacterium]